MAPRKDVVATTKFIAGFLLLNALYLALGLWAWTLGFRRRSILIPVLFALSGFGCLKLAEQGGQFGEHYGFGHIVWLPKLRLKNFEKKDDNSRHKCYKPLTTTCPRFRAYVLQDYNELNTSKFCRKGLSIYEPNKVVNSDYPKLQLTMVESVLRLVLESINRPRFIKKKNWCVVG